MDKLRTYRNRQLKLGSSGKNALASRIAAVFLVSVLLLSACSKTVVIQGAVPTPLVSQIPLRLGIYYSDSFKNFSYEESLKSDGNWTIELGQQNVLFFRELFTTLFLEVIEVDQEQLSAEAIQTLGLDGILVPEIEEYGFLTHVVDPVKLNGHLVSSSYVRELIEDGEVMAAGEFLGRHYSIPGPVIEGYKTGQAIGFPTANLDTSRIQIPGTGVYAVHVIHQGKKYNGVVNVGFNPTFDRDTLSVEAHIFDFDERIYGQKIEVVFIRRIRSEKKFKSADQLVEQIQKDIQVAKTILADLP